MYPDNLNDNSIGGGSTQAWAAGIDHNMEYVAYKAVEFIEANASKIGSCTLTQRYHIRPM